MSDPQLSPKMPSIDHALGAQRAASAGIKVRQRKGLSLVLITPRNAMQESCAGQLKAFCGFEPPAAAKIVQGAGLSLCWQGPGRWLAMAEDRPKIEAELKVALANSASLVDLSDARIVLRITGPMTRSLFEKGLAVDLHPRVFKPGDTAITLLSHITIQIYQVDEAATFDLVISRATAQDIFHWLAVSAAEFGFDVVKADGTELTNESL